MNYTTFFAAFFVLFINIGYAQKNAINKNFFKEFERALNLNENDKFEDAQDILEDIPEQDSLYLEAQYRLQEMYLKSENFPKVVSIGLKMSGMPYTWGHYVYFNWALALSKMEKHEEAFRVINQGLMNFSESHLLHYLRGCILQDLKRNQEAITSFQRAIQAYPFHAYSHIQLGEIAATEGKQTQAVMSFAFATLLDLNDELKAQIHNSLNSVSIGDFTVEERGLTFDSGDDFSETDRIIRSKIALSPKFKLKTKIKGFYYIRQLQAICETMEYQPNSDGFWMQFYGRFFKSVFNSDNFESMSFVSVSGPDYGKFNAAANKNTKKRDQFFKWFGNTVGENIGKQYLEFDGKKQFTFVEFGQYNVEARGLGTSFDNRKGVWNLYDGINGRPTGSGIYENGKRSGEWVIYDESNGKLLYKITYANDLMNGLFTVYYPSGSKRVLVTMKNDQRDGPAITLFESGDTLIAENYKNGLRQGSYTLFYPDKSVKMFGNIVDDQWNGLLTEYHPNGKMSGVYSYKNDEKDGPFTSYHLNGQLYQKGTYKVGILVEDYEEYYNSGQLKSRGRYKNGNLSGRWVAYYYDGKLEQEFEFDENGKQNGIQKSYGRDGKLHYEMEYKNGEMLSYKFFKKDGNIQAEAKRNGKKLNYEFYNSTGFLITQGLLENDEKQGTWIYNNEQGIKEKEVSYEKGKISGISKTFFTNGSLNASEEYINDELNGLVLVYHPNQELKIEGYVKNGKRNGMWYQYYPDGKLKEKNYFVDGEVVGWSDEYAVSGLPYIRYFHADNDIKKAVYFDVAGNPLDTVSNYHGEIQVVNPNGKDYRAKNNFKNDARQGLSQGLYLNNKIEESGHFINDVKHGIWKEYYEQGQLNTHIKYFYGEIDSVQTDYRMNGNVASRTPYKSGIVNGIQENYHPDGKLHFKVNFVDNKREGESLMKLPTGEVYAIFYYENDQLVAYSYEDANGQVKPRIPILQNQELRCFFKNGENSFVADRVNGTWHNKYLVYNLKGDVVESRQYKDGLFHGTSTFNLSSKLVYSVINYELGLRHGLMKIHHLNGNLMLESNYLFGVKHGEEKEFDKAGKLIFSRVYYNDQMISETKM